MAPQEEHLPGYLGSGEGGAGLCPGAAGPSLASSPRLGSALAVLVKQHFAYKSSQEH